MFYQTHRQVKWQTRRIDMKIAIALLNKKGENTIPTVLSAVEQNKRKSDAKFEVATEKGCMSEKDLSSLPASKICSATTLGYASTAPTQSQPHFSALKEGTLLFDGRIYTPTPKAADFVTQQIDQPNPAQAAEAFLQTIEGEYYLIAAQSNKLIAVRDPVGVQPLYYGENLNLAALAADRKTLWKLGLEPKCFPPGHIATITANGFDFRAIKTLKMEPPKNITIEEAADTLQKLLVESIQRRVLGQKKVAVAFSGGLDSSVVACLAQRCGVQVELVHVSLENQAETEAAFEAAKLLDLPMQVHLYKESDVEKTVPKVVELIEEPAPVNVSIGVPFYWTAQKTAELGYRVLLAGQGADELFGGYQRYVNQFMVEGNDAVRETMFKDVATIHETNVERDEKLCIYNDVELRLPFASYAVAEFAMSLPTELKFECKEDTLRKLTLRAVARNLGLPAQISDKPKKAVQYSTGIGNALKKIAKQHNQTLQQYIQEIFDKMKKETQR